MANRAIYWVLGNVFNLGSQQPTNMKTIIDLCINISKKNISINELETKNHYGEKYQDIINRIPDSSKAFNLLGWRAKITPEEGIKKIYDWIKNNDWYLD
jgi:UDP-glucose 4-epimerase